MELAGWGVDSVGALGAWKYCAAAEALVVLAAPHHFRRVCE